MGHTGRQGLELIRRHRPDVAFLDVKMPDLSGVELAGELAQGDPPAIVFVTAYSRFACEAFDAAAADYVLKPFSLERLRTALDRARSALERKDLAQRVEELTRLVAALREDAGEPEDGGVRELWVSAREGPLRLAVADVDWLQADRDYVKVHIGDQVYLRREPLHRLADRLDPKMFARVHRSALVRTAAIAQLLKGAGRDTKVLLRGGHVVPVARRYAHAVRAMVRRE